MNLDSLKKLYVHELKDLYSAENQLVEALPKMAKAATDQGLKQAFTDHLAETKEHVQRLEQIFQSLEFSPSGHKCGAMEGLIHEGEEVIQSGADPHVLDAALIGAAQRVEHYEMAGYGTARAFAEALGDQQAASLLQQTLDEEGAADQKLTDLAIGGVNAAALQSA